MPVECIQSPEVELSTSSGIGQISRRSLDFASRNNSVEFNITDLDCNIEYLPSVGAALGSNVQQLEYGNSIFFGGKCKFKINS